MNFTGEHASSRTHLLIGLLTTRETGRRWQMLKMLNFIAFIRAAMLCTVFFRTAKAAAQQTTFDPAQKNVLVQFGEPRTGSTYQYMSLCLTGKIMAGLTEKNYVAFFTTNVSEIADRCSFQESFCVVKTHKLNVMSEREMGDFFGPSGRAMLFISVKQGHERNMIQKSSENVFSLAISVQEYESFVGMSPLENAQELARPFRDLILPEHILYMQEYMKIWKVIRQCCGSQASADQRNSLHGLSNAPLKHALYMPDAPECSMYNLTATSLRLSRTVFATGFTLKNGRTVSLSQVAMDSRYCEETNAKIVSGEDFNGAKWNGAPVS